MALFTTFSFSSDRRLYVEAKRGKIGSSSIKLHSSTFAVSYAIFPIANRAYDKNKISFLDIICGAILFQNELQPIVYSKCTTVICFHLKMFQGVDQVNYCHSQDYLGLQNVIKWLFFYCTNHNIFSGDFLVW